MDHHRSRPEHRRLNRERYRAEAKAYETKQKAADLELWRLKRAEQARNWRAKNREKVRAGAKARYLVNKDDIAARSKAKRIARGTIGSGGKHGWAKKLLAHAGA